MLRLKVERYRCGPYEAFGLSLGRFGWISLWPRRWRYYQATVNAFYRHVAIGPFEWTRAR